MWSSRGTGGSSSRSRSSRRRSVVVAAATVVVVAGARPSMTENTTISTMTALMIATCVCVLREGTACLGCGTGAAMFMIALGFMTVTTISCHWHLRSPETGKPAGCRAPWSKTRPLMSRVSVMSLFLTREKTLPNDSTIVAAELHVARPAASRPEWLTIHSPNKKHDRNNTP